MIRAGPVVPPAVWPTDSAYRRRILRWSREVRHTSAPASITSLGARMLPTLCMDCYLCRPSLSNVNLGFVTGVAVEPSTLKA
jgi:hypothetical protein